MNLSPLDLLSKGWNLIRNHLTFFVILSIVYFIFIAIPQLESYLFKLPLTVSLGLSILSLLILIIFTSTYILANHRVYHQMDVGIKTIGDSLKYYLQIFVAFILTSLISMVGFIFCILPGIYLSTRLLFTPYFIIVDNMNAIEAIEASWKMTSGRFWNIFGIYFVFCIFQVLSLILFVVGYFFLLPAQNMGLYLLFIEYKKRDEMAFEPTSSASNEV